MLLFEMLLFYLFIGGFVQCAQGTETNIASQRNGGKCQSSFSGPCANLIDGIVSGASTQRWVVGTGIIGQWVQFDFDAAYHLNEIVVTHSHFEDERNIKQVNLSFEDGTFTLFDLQNKVTGSRETDSMPLSANSNYTNMTITQVYTEDKNFCALYEVEIFAMTSSTTSTTVATTNAPTIIVNTSPTNSETASIENPTTSSFTTTNSMSTATVLTSTTTNTTTTRTTSTKSTTETENPKTTETKSSSKAPATTVSMIYSTIYITESDSDERTGTSSENPPIRIIVGVVMAILVIAVVLLVVGLIFLRRRRKKKIDEQSTDANVYVNMETLEVASESGPEITKLLPVTDSPKDDKKSDSSPDISPQSSVQDLKLVDSEPEYANTQQLPVNSNAIKINNLASTVDNMLQKSTMFQEEFKSIPAGKQHATTFADRSTLQPKNRFKNIKPYDHSRVSLVHKESDDSVYINANFISAFKRPKYYIAAQGPNNNTVTDFWRMIWEQHVSVIVMVTNCIEGGKDKCRQYWPDGEKGAHQSSGDFDVVLDKNTLIADYTVRDFKLSQNDESRNVRQYHYTSWPDEGVPTSCSALISFVNRIREFTEDKDPPIVVHCSAGVGRTGTFIVVNYSIDMAREEGIVDIKKVVHRLREDRINMVQTLSQYKFLYALMLECLYCGEVTIPCQGASEKIQQIFIKEDGMDSPAEKQWIVLEVLKPKKYDEECLAGKDDNIEKNRTQTILPHDNHRPYLRRRPDYTSNYINAVFVDGYKQKNKFLLTQHPLENTIVDLWRTVSDFNVSTIVMLNGCEENADAYWPEDEFSEALQYGDFLEVTFKRVDKQVDFTITELDLSEDKEKANVVTHIHVKNWSEDSKPKLSILPALYNTVSQAQMTDEDSRIMIHSLNGGGNTGVYCALHQIFDKIKEEQEIDIFNAVKNTRMPRPDSIPDLETYKYLHEASVQFIEEFSTYANIR